MSKESQDYFAAASLGRARLRCETAFSMSCCPFFFWQKILRGKGFRDRLDVGLDRRLHVARLLRPYGAGPRQVVPGKIVERDLRGVFVVAVRALPAGNSGPTGARV